MERIAVFLNDAAHAREVVTPLQRRDTATHWVLAACPPPLTRHAGRWLSKAARRAWVERWSADLFAQIKPLLEATPGSRVETMIAPRDPAELATRLARQRESIRVFDARHVHVGQTLEPLGPDIAAPTHPWAAPVAAAAGLSSVLALAD
jgi:hypothetical protein